MSVQQKLRELGWYVADTDLAKITENGKLNDVRTIVKTILDLDLRDFGSGGFPTEGKGVKLDSIPGGCVVQILRTRNISAPKSNEESKAAPRLLLIDLTDGQTQYSGLEFDHITGLSLNTPPGTKLLLKNGPIEFTYGLLLLKPSNVQILGGNVPALVEKWELTRHLSKYAKGGRIHSGSSGPPPWIPYGKKLEHTAINDVKDFKSLAAEREKELAKENVEFEALRSEAIAEATKVGTKKVFGGGQKPMVDHNVKKVMDLGFDEEEARYALKFSRDNTQRAVGHLRSKGAQSNVTESSGGGSGNGDSIRGRRNHRDGQGRRGDYQNDNDDEMKPSGKVSLFDFIGEKLPITASKKNDVEFSQFKEIGNLVESRSSSHNRSKFENNISYSFANRQKSDPSIERHRGGGVGGAGGRGSESGRRRGGGTDRMRGNPDVRGKGGRISGSKYQSGKNETAPQQQSQSLQLHPQVEVPVRQERNSDRGGRGGHNGRGGRFGTFKSEQNEVKGAFSSKYDRLSSKQLIENPPKTTRTNFDLTSIEVPSVASAAGGGRAVGQQQQELKQPPPTRQQRQEPKSFGQLNFNYNPNKIVGFQNKESNEFAMCLLRAQTETVFGNTETATQTTRALHSLEKNVQPQKPFEQQLRLQIHSNFTENTNPTSFTKSSQPTQMFKNQSQRDFIRGVDQPEAWHWSIGDRCLAKYWEDGRCYNAEITGVSDKTCVVHFMEYDNFEEVLKVDCLPITDVFQNMINSNQESAPYQNHRRPQQASQKHSSPFYQHENNHNSYSQPQQLQHQQQLDNYQHQHQHQHQHQRQHHSQRGAPRAREGRPMYVPPAQRNK